MKKRGISFLRPLIETIVIVFLLSMIITLLLLNVVFTHAKQIPQTTSPVVTMQKSKEVEPIIGQAAHATATTAKQIAATTTLEYIEVTDSCGVHYDGSACLNARSGPGTEYPAVAKLRTGMVLKVGNTVEKDGTTWYKIAFDEPLRYPDRITSPWYVSGAFVTLIHDVGDQTLANTAQHASSSKYIVVYRSQEKLFAYDGDTLFMEAPISVGLALTPTPRGTFTIFEKKPSRYMQGPLPYLKSDQYYDLPGVPWDLYFTQQGAVIHGAYWHNDFGHPYSHGCVNLSPDNAKKLYQWADVGTQVIVKD